MYGVTKDYVMGLEFFDVNGETIKTGGRTVKCVTGYNLAALLVGSEGTLGVVSKIILKIIPPPAARQAMVATFPDVAKACETVAAIIAARVVPATLEFMDNFTIRTVEDYSHAGLPVEAQALLLIEVDGHPAMVAEDAAKVEEICRRHDATDIKVAQDAAQRDKVWAARRTALSALAKVKPTVVLEDATVPRSQIPAMMQAIQDIAKEYRLLIGTFGHAGDGNLHPTILTDKRNQEEWHRVEAAVDAIFDRALALGGLSRESMASAPPNPVFSSRRPAPVPSYTPSGLKAALDPKNILNPGKMLGD